MDSLKQKEEGSTRTFLEKLYYEIAMRPLCLPTEPTFLIFCGPRPFGASVAPHPKMCTKHMGAKKSPKTTIVVALRTVNLLTFYSVGRYILLNVFALTKLCLIEKCYKGFSFKVMCNH